MIRWTETKDAYRLEFDTRDIVVSGFLAPLANGVMGEYFLHRSRPRPGHRRARPPQQLGPGRALPDNAPHKAFVVGAHVHPGQAASSENTITRSAGFGW